MTQNCTAPDLRDLNPAEEAALGRLLAAFGQGRVQPRPLASSESVPQPVVILFSDPILTFETVGSLLLCKALALRGHRVTALVPGLPLGFGPGLPDLAAGAEIWRFIEGILADCGVPLARLSDSLRPDDAFLVERALECASAGQEPGGALEGLADMARRHACILTLSYAPEQDPLFPQRFEQCLYSAGYSLLAARRLCAQLPPGVTVVAFNGRFLFNEALSRAAAECGLDAVTWEAGPRSGTLIFTRERTAAPLYPFDGLWEKWKDVPLGSVERETILAHLNLRLKGRGLHSPLASEVGALPPWLADAGKRRIILFANVPWDSATTGRTGVFGSIGDWLVETVRHFSHRPEYELVLRGHPYIGITGWSSQSIEALLQARLGELPENLRLMVEAHQLPIGAFALVQGTYVVYNSSSVFELAHVGKRVVMAADGHQRAKGFTLDPATRADYFAMLEAAPPPALTEAETESLLRYAYFIYYRVLVTCRLCCVGVNAGMGSLDWLEAPENLLPGNNEGLDVICDAIAGKRDFIMGELP